MSPEAKGILVAGLALSVLFVLIATTMNVGKIPLSCPTLTALPTAIGNPVAEPTVPSLRDLAEAKAQHAPRQAPLVRARNIVIAQANMWSGMTDPQFDRDLSTVVSGGPDFVTLNETYHRTDAQMRPQGYDVWRSAAPFDARETPVLWRTDRWTLVDHGTLLMHFQQGKWGIRYTNWVTLAAKVGGQVVSVISVHTSPGGKGRGTLLRQYLNRLDQLVTALRPRGPVIVGGDFNADYLNAGARNFLTAQFGQMQAAPTVQTLGAPPGGYRTDHGGGALDYVVLSGAAALGQSVSPLTYSDHKMVRALVHLPGKRLPVAARPATATTRKKAVTTIPAVVATPTPPAAVSEQPVGCIPAS